MTSPAIAQDVDLASLPQRLAAQFLDGLVVAVPVCALALTGMKLYGSSAWPAGVLIAAAILFAMAYVLFSDGLEGGQSLGKRWVGIRCVSAETGAPCTFWQSFVRNILLSILGPIDWIFIFGARRQRLGDKAAGTIVIVD
jgi:uncharacterized RDD family membrane protein YckC